MKHYTKPKNHKHSSAWASATSTDCRWHRIHLPELYVRHRVPPAPPNYDGSSTGCQFDSSPYKLAVITYCTRSTGTPVYLSDLIKNYHPSRTLRSADILLLSVPQMTLALSTKAFSVSAPSVWNSLSYNWGQLSLSVVSGVLWKLNCLMLRTANVNTLPSPAQHAPLTRLRHMALYKCLEIDWLIVVM